MLGATAVTARFRLQEILEQVGMSPGELSRRSGVPLVTIHRMCHNLTSQVSLETLGALARALGMPAGNIIADGEPPGGRRT